MTRFTAGSSILLVIAAFMGLSQKLHLCMSSKYAAPGYLGRRRVGDFSGDLSMGQSNRALT